VLEPENRNIGQGVLTFLGRPTYCRRTYVLLRILSVFLLSFFRRIISELAERNSTKIGHMLGSNGDLKTHAQNMGYPLPLQIGGPKSTFLGDFAT